VTSACVEYGATLRDKARSQQPHLAQEQRSRTVKTAARIILTTILALTALPAFAATEARAYAPASIPTDEVIDFGIGSQR
jgi:hypothetical protein